MRLLKTIRFIIQAIFLGLFIYFFAATATVANHLYINPFFSSDPLIFGTTSVALRMLLPFVLPLILILLTAVFGRFFCGFVCPLGTMIDGSDFMIGKVRPAAKSFKSFKYYLLLFLVVISVVSASLLHLFDPITITSRTFTAVLRPAVGFFKDSGQVHNGFVFLGIFVLILGLGIVQKRFWCGNICPLGALLGIAGRLSIVRFSMKDECTECGVCERVCPTRAINIEQRHVSQYECIRCLACLEDCKEHEMRLTLARPSLGHRAPDLSRRGFVGAVGLGLVVGPLLKTELLGRTSLARIIRPPGSIPEGRFLDACVRCGECIKVCPTNGLQPTILQRGWHGLFAPQLATRIGGCERNCNGCGQVCPTGAIRKLSLEEKSYVKIGTAVIHKEMCLAWEQDKLCLICDETCPYNAIDSRQVDIMGSKLSRPFVNEELCTGCGICESRCPIAGPSAIEVLPIGEERLRSGPYITPRKKALRESLEKGIFEDVPTGFTE